MSSSPRVAVSGFADRRLALRIAAAGRRVLGKLRCPALSVTVRGVPVREAAVLNRRHRGKAAPAEVLAFPLAPEDPRGVAGEVCLCPEAAARRAARFGIPRLDWTEELAVHGILHTLGFHHDTPQAGKEMFALQRSLRRDRR